ncbi:MAG: hypothetical protein ABEJ79_05505 [Halolamina sp.]
MSADDESTVRYHGICPLCNEVVSKETTAAARQVVYNHNEMRHDGEEVARVVSSRRAALNEFLDYVDENFSAEVFERVEATVVDTEPWGALDPDEE